MIRTRRGTTVLELVIALLVTGVVATTGARAFEQVIARRAQVLQVTSSTERDSALRALLHEWIDSGVSGPPVDVAVREQFMREAREVPRTLRDQRPALHSIAYSESDALYFTTRVIPSADGATTSVRLYVDDDPETPERGLTVEYQLGRSQPSTRVELDPSMRRMRVSYLDATTRQWRPLTQLGSATALAARVHLGVDDPARARLLALPLTFPITHGAVSALGPAGEVVP